MPKGDPKAPITKEMLDQVVDAILKGVEQMLEDLRKDLWHEMNTGFSEMKSSQSNLKCQLTDLNIDTPTRKEFNDLQTRVDKYHPH